MSEVYYYWDCTNQECESRNNKVEISIVEAALNEKKRLHVFCAVCGFAPTAKKITVKDRSGAAVNVCDCLPFEGSESRLPMRKTSTGNYIDCNANEHEQKFFLDLGIYPDAYLSWIKHNKPSHIDLSK